MWMYINNQTGSVCFLGFIDSKKNKAKFEYSWGSRISIAGYIKDNYTKIDFISRGEISE